MLHPCYEHGPRKNQAEKSGRLSWTLFGLSSTVLAKELSKNRYTNNSIPHMVVVKTTFTNHPHHIRQEYVNITTLIQENFFIIVSIIKKIA